MTTEQRSGDAAIEVVEYDTTWPARFLEERALLERTLAPWLVGTIEHIGSTAVPGLVATRVTCASSSRESSRTRGATRVRC